MFFASVIRDYFIWHYGRAWFQLWGLWRNFMWFGAHFFSLSQLARSWIAPFKRITEQKSQGWNAEDFASYILINLLSRVVGAIARTAIIFAGLCVLCAGALAGIAITVLWALLPLVIIGLLGMSLSLFFINI